MLATPEALQAVVLGENGLAKALGPGHVYIDMSTVGPDSYPPNFKLRHAAKDLRLVVEAATAAGRDLEVSAAARAWLDLAARKGAADLDYSAVVATIVGEERQQ